MAVAANKNPGNGSLRVKPLFVLFWIVVGGLLIYIFRQSFNEWYGNISRENSYYSHAVLVPFVSLFFVWRQREALAQVPWTSSPWGYAAVALACLMVLASDLLGVRVLGQAATLPLAAGFVLLFMGTHCLRVLWFPVAFLVFMVPMPESMTTSITFRIKMIAAEGAVRLAHLFYMPMIRDGSYIHFRDDFLLVGDVCGGLRSLIALLALGAIVSYLSDTRTWARITILVVAAPIAVLTNLLRIFGLCVVANIWGSNAATGWVHDISGYLIYVVALALLFGCERLLHRMAPADQTKQPAEES